MTKQILPLQGLRCDHCVQTVRAAILAVDGVTACHVDLATAQADLEYDAALVTREQLVAVVRQAGFDVAEPNPEPVALVSIGQLVKPVSAPSEMACQVPQPAQGELHNRRLSERVLFDVTGMHCASCVARVESSLTELTGVEQARANLATNQVSVVTVASGPSIEEVVAAIRRAGYNASLAAAPEAAAESMRRREQTEVVFWRRRLIVAAVLLVPLMMIDRLLASEPRWVARWLQLLLATPIQFYVGWPYLRGPLGIHCCLSPSTVGFLGPLPWLIRWLPTARKRLPTCESSGST